MKSIRGRFVIIVLSIILLMAFIIPVNNFSSKLMYRINTYLPNNLYVDGIHFGGKTLEEAEKQLNIIAENKLKSPLTISYNGNGAKAQAYTYTLEQLGYYADIDALTKGFDRLFDKNTSIIKRFVEYKKIENSKREYKLNYAIHKDKFMNALEVFDSTGLVPPQNAKFSYEEGKLKLINEEKGYLFDKESLYNELLRSQNLKTASLQVKAVEPTITAELLAKQGIKESAASFTTKFDPGNVPRSSNIRLAAKYIDGVILAPGATFSFNEIVGERTVEKGFKEAGVYISGRVDTGIGGGICQVSTTLYNAVLLADLQVLERNNHSLTVPYVPLSRDAAVSWGVQDFKFVNNTDYHMYVHSRTTSSSITFELISTKSNKEVELVSTMISKSAAPIMYKDDIAIEVGKELVLDKGHDGFESQLTKKVFVNGKLVSTGIVSKDKYLTAAKIVLRGTKPIEIYTDMEKLFE